MLCGSAPKRSCESLSVALRKTFSISLEIDPFAWAAAAARVIAGTPAWQSGAERSSNRICWSSAGLALLIFISGLLGSLGGTPSAPSHHHHGPEPWATASGIAGIVILSGAALDLLRTYGDDARALLAALPLIDRKLSNGPAYMCADESGFEVSLLIPSSAHDRPDWLQKLGLSPHEDTGAGPHLQRITWARVAVCPIRAALVFFNTETGSIAAVVPHDAFASYPEFSAFEERIKEWSTLDDAAQAQRAARFLANRVMSCTTCGYSLSGAAGKVCAECGTPLRIEELIYLGARAPLRA
ncbi:hypothetical protein BH11PLA1_BH11PLA1_02630 [soil metagenome]